MTSLGERLIKSIKEAREMTADRTMFRRRPTLEEIERTEVVANDIQQATPEPDDNRPDPAPSVPSIAEERAQQLITNISSQTLAELRKLREQIDDLMRDMNDRRDMISEAIRSHAEFAETTIQHKMIIAESIDNIRASFDKSRTPLPPLGRV